MVARTFTLLALGAVALAASSRDGLGQTSGKVLFDAHCARCHNVGGLGGEGPKLAVPTLRHAPDDESLGNIMRNGLPNTEMPGNFMLGDAEIDALVAYVRALGRVEAGEVLSGDPQRGRVLFEGKAACNVCHIVDGEGGNLGPDLSIVGQRRGVDHLRESLVAPGASVSDTYLTIDAVTLDGREIRGVRVNEDTFTIQIRDDAGGFASFEKRSLQKLEKRFGESLMPSYVTDLSADEVEDVVAFLAGLRGEP